jgi:hypothetical protein
MRRFKLLWAFAYLYSWIKTRGRSEQEPFGIIIDEFAHMTQKVAGGTNPLAQELDEFINVYMRQHTIWFSCAHQELYQIDEQLLNTLLSLGTYILGSTSSMESARTLADAVFSRDPYLVKHYKNVWGSAQDPKGGIFPLYFVIDVEPEFLPLDEQTELFAQQIKKLGRFQFLLRPALAEGHIGSVVLPLTIRHEDVDPYTGQYQFPDNHLIARVRRVLAEKSGIPIQRLLTEQAGRLLPAPVQRTPTPAQTGNGRRRNSDIQPVRGRHTSRDGQGKGYSQTAKPPANTPIAPPRRRYPISQDEG